MKMITAMCAMGSTENMGTFATPYKDEIADFMQTFFAGYEEEIEVIGEIKEDTNYLYIYDDPDYDRLGNYDVYLYDSDTDVLYFFHNNI